jgi:hypothetical protein
MAVFIIEQSGGVCQICQVKLYQCDSLLYRWLFQRTGYRVKRFTQISADSIRAAEVRSAEATELPVWMRPPVSVANGLCHPWHWIPGRCPG